MHDIVTQIVRLTSLALPGFHAWTGADDVESIRGKGKKTCWDLWQKFPEFTPAFTMLCQMNPTTEDVNSVMPQLNKYAAYLFQTTRDFGDVDSLRRHTFIHKGKPFDALPPGSDALMLHTHRAAFRAGHVWGKVLVPMMNVPSLKD